MRKSKSKNNVKDNKQKSTGNSSVKESRNKVKVYVLGAILILVLAASCYGFWHTSQPEFCYSCHSNLKNIDSQITKKHDTVSCNACHWPGFIGAFKQKISLVNETYSFYTKSYDLVLNENGHIGKNMPDDACVQCHEISRKLDSSKKVPGMKHAIHIKKKIVCTACHNRIAHPAAKAYADNMKMEGCFKCHGLTKTAKAPGKCKTCHASNFKSKPVDHRSEAWAQAGHSAIANYEKTNCDMCHLTKYCDDCHGISLPHPTGFRKDHADAGTKNEKSCRKCHNAPDFCSSCHHYGYTGAPGTWLANHSKLSSKSDADKCLECHTPTYCASCHTKYK